MPQRLLRPTIRQSRRWNRLPYVVQSFYVRLLTLVDDFARYEAEPELLRSEAFPYGDPAGNLLTSADICCHLTALVSSDMVILYEFKGVKYLQLTRWQERTRALESKYPDPKHSKILSQIDDLLTNDSSCQQMSASPPSPSPSPSPQPQPSPSPGARVEEIKRLAAGIAGKMKVNEPTQAQRDLNLSALIQIQNKLNEVYKRPPEQRWVYAEEQALSEISRRPGVLRELAHIFYFRAQMPADERRRFFPQSIDKLLANWSATLDKARVQAPMPRSQPVKAPANRPPEMPIEQARKLWHKAKGEAKV